MSISASKEGALLTTGGKRVGDRGYFISPAVFANVKHEMRISQEEIFGPVVSVIKFRDEADALRIANGTAYSLAAGVWNDHVKPDLNGHIALVTGGSRGIGAAIATALAEAGAAVAVNYRERAADSRRGGRRHQEQGRPRDRGRRRRSQAAAVAEMVDHVAFALGPIDILVNNAGMAIVRGIDDLTEGRVRCDHRGQPEIGLSLHPGRAAGDAREAMGPHRQYLLRCGARRRRDRRALQCVESRHGGTDPRLRGAAGQGRHHRQRGGAVADRNRHDARPLGSRAPASRSAGSGQPDEVAQAVLMVLGNDYMTGQTIMLNGGMAFV